MPNSRAARSTALSVVPPSGRLIFRRRVNKPKILFAHCFKLSMGEVPPSHSVAAVELHEPRETLPHRFGSPSGSVSMIHRGGYPPLVRAGPSSKLKGATEDPLMNRNKLMMTFLQAA